MGRHDAAIAHRLPSVRHDQTAYAYAEEPDGKSREAWWHCCGSSSRCSTWDSLLSSGLTDAHLCAV